MVADVVQALEPGDGSPHLYDAVVTQELSDAIAAEIGRLLDERGWTGRELARRTGLTQSSVSRKLAGTRRFDIDDLPPICKALEVDVRDLIGWAQAR